MVSVIAILLGVQTVPATDVNAVDFTWLFVKMLLMLGIVTISAIVILKYVVPRLGIVRRLKKNNFFTIIARFSLDARKKLYVVEVGKRYFVIGASEHAINMLAELKRDDVMSNGRDAESRG